MLSKCSTNTTTVYSTCETTVILSVLSTFCSTCIEAFWSTFSTSNSTAIIAAHQNSQRSTRFPSNFFAFLSTKPRPFRYPYHSSWCHPNKTAIWLSIRSAFQAAFCSTIFSANFSADMSSNSATCNATQFHAITAACLYTNHATQQSADVVSVVTTTHAANITTIASASRKTFS